MEDDPMVELEQDRLETITEGLASMPQNTKLAYKGPIKEFKQWCEEKRFIDRDTVTELKLNSFIRHCVQGRESRKKKKNQTQPSTVSYSVVNQYVGGITHLWKFQVSNNMNTHSNPRTGPTMKTTLDSLGRKEYSRKRTHFIDRGKGALDDGIYSLTQVKEISDYYIACNSQNTLRDRMGFLFSISMLLRSESLCEAELADLALFELENEGILSPSLYLFSRV